MSDFLAEARVIVRPDTTRFRAELEAQLRAATIKPVVVPVVASTAGLATTAVATESLAAANRDAAVGADQLAIATTRSDIALRKEAVAAEAAGAAAARSAVSHNRLALSQNQVRQGALSSALSLGGVRGATLAASSSFLIAAASTAAFFKTLSLAADFERQLATFRVTASATADDLARVSERARQLGSDIRLPAVSAGEAVTAMVELSKAGLSVTDSLEAAEGVLQLATAAEIDNAAATELVANALNAFALNGREATTVADLLATASIEAQGSIEDMGIALRQSAAVAKQAGLSVSQTVTLLTLLAKAGIAGSDAGTTLRVAISRLIAPTERAREEIAKLNLDLRDAQGNLRVDVFSQLGRALEGVGKQRQSEILVRIFGENAQRVAAILARQTVPELNSTQQALKRTGTAADIAGAKMAGLGGKAERTRNEFEQLGLSLGQIFAPAAGGGLDVINTSLQGMNKLLEGAIKDFEELAKFEEDANQLAEALRAVSDDSGFSDFLDDVGEGARLVGSDIERASDAVDDFLGNLLGVGGGADRTTPKIQGLTAAEIKLAEGTRDANLGLAEQIKQLNATADAADSAEKAVTVGIDVKIAVAEATGANDQEVLRLLREKEANQARFLERMLNLPQTKSRQKTVEDAARNLEQTRDAIQAILDGEAAASKQAAQDAAQAISDADRAQLDSISLQEGKLNNAAIVAQATENLKDDVKAQQAIRDFYKKSIAEVRKTVKDAQLAAETIAGLTRDLITAQQELADLKRQQKEAIRAERREALLRIEEGLDLDLQIAQTTGNISRQRKALNAEIEFYKGRIRATREGSNQRKQWILKLRQAQAELKELKGETEKTGRGFQEMAFEFLQAQQGFAANLFGNLIPGGATAGLVGNVSTTAGGVGSNIDLGIGRAVQQAQGRDGSGFSAGQGNSVIDILRRIERGIRELNRGSDAPEARYQRAVGSATMDGAGGGTLDGFVS